MPKLGDAEFTEFVRTRSVALLRTAYLLTGDRGHAEDLLQTALAKVYVSLHRIREPQAIEAYVRRTLVTTATTWWRTKARRGERLWADGFPDPGTPARTEEIDERTRIWSLVHKLPVRQRAIIVLRYYEDLTEVETAAVLGCAVGTVKAQTHRALTRMRSTLGDRATAALLEEGA